VPAIVPTRTGGMLGWLKCRLSHDQNGFTVNGRGGIFVLAWQKIRLPYEIAKKT
jgi:hypothetical protein